MRWSFHHGKIKGSGLVEMPRKDKGRWTMNEKKIQSTDGLTDRERKVLKLLAEGKTWTRSPAILV
jgi:DNA-binding NarL/FixJ family response regulator